jgi:hypothetical protein
MDMRIIAWCLEILIELLGQTVLVLPLIGLITAVCCIGGFYASVLQDFLR